MHSLPLNCYGDSIILNSPPIQYLCLACQAAMEPMKWQNTSNNGCHAGAYNKQPGSLSLLTRLSWAILRKGPLHLHMWAMGRQGDEKWWDCHVCQLTRVCVSRSRHPLRATDNSLSLAEVSIYLKESCQGYDGWEKNIFPSPDIQSAGRQPFYPHSYCVSLFVFAVGFCTWTDGDSKDLNF